MTSPLIIGKDYIVELKVKNGPLLRAMRRAGHYTTAEFSRATGVTQSAIGGYLNLKRTPIHGKTGAWLPAVVRMSEYFRCLPEDLFPPQHITQILTKNIAEFEMTLEEVKELPSSARHLIENQTPESVAIEKEINSALSEGLKTLSSCEREILERRFGLNDYEPQTVGQISKVFGMSSDRIRQIEERALKFLKRPARSRPIVDAGYVKPRPARNLPIVPPAAG